MWQIFDAMSNFCPYLTAGMEEIHVKDHLLRKVLWGWDRLITNIALALLVLLTFSGVIFRYIFNSPINWLEEIQTMFIVWIVFLGGCVAFRENGHVVVEILVELFPKRVQKVIAICVSAVILAVLGIGAVLAFRYVMVFVLNGRCTSILRIPYYIVYSVVPVSFVWMIVSYLNGVFFGRDGEEEEK